MNKATLIIIPLAILLMATLMAYGSLTDDVQQARIQSGNYSVNEEYDSLTTSPIDFQLSTIVAVLVTGFMAIALAMSIKVLGSGLSGSVVPIVFVCGIGLTVWGILSAFALGVFLEIPAFGIPLYFGLSIMFLMGLITSSVGGGE